MVVVTCESRVVVVVWNRCRVFSGSSVVVRPRRSGERPANRVRGGGGGGGMMGWCGWKGIRLRGTCFGEKRTGGRVSVNWAGGGMRAWKGGGGGGLWVGGGGMCSEPEE